MYHLLDYIEIDRLIYTVKIMPSRHFWDKKNC